MRWVLVLLCLAATSARAESGAERLLATYRAAADAYGGSPAFSAERGRRFYLTVHKSPNGEHACASCHSPDPRETVFGHSGAIRAECTACHLGASIPPSDRARIRRDIKPFAPVANPDRFADPDKAELWFAVNCFYVLGRACTLQEKGDLLTWLLSVN